MIVMEIEREKDDRFRLTIQGGRGEVSLEALWLYPSHRAAEWAADDFMLGLALVYLYTHSLASQMEGEDSIELEVYRGRYGGNGFTITSGGGWPWSQSAPTRSTVALTLLLKASWFGWPRTT